MARWQCLYTADGRSNFVVSRRGRGLRAAFWTATVLGAIQDGAR